MRYKGLSVPKFFTAFPLKWSYEIIIGRRFVKLSTWLFRVVGDWRKRRLKEDRIENDAKLDLRFIWLFPLDVFFWVPKFFFKKLSRDFFRALEKTSLTRTC